MGSARSLPVDCDQRRESVADRSSDRCPAGTGDRLRRHGCARDVQFRSGQEGTRDPPRSGTGGARNGAHDPASGSRCSEGGPPYDAFGGRLPDAGRRSGTTSAALKMLRAATLPQRVAGDPPRRYAVCPSEGAAAATLAPHRAAYGFPRGRSDHAGQKARAQGWARTGARRTPSSGPGVRRRPARPTGPPAADTSLLPRVVRALRRMRSRSTDPLRGCERRDAWPGA